MKTFFTPFLFLIPSFLWGQAVDTAAVIGQVDSLIQLNLSLVGKQKFNEALQVIEAAATKAEFAFGKNHASYARCLLYHGRTFYVIGRYVDTEPLYLEAKAIQEKTVGKEHPDYAATLNWMGGLYKETGRKDLAELFLLDAIAIRRRVLGKEHPDYANSLNNLGILYREVGRFEEAEPLFLEAKAIREKVLGKEHPLYANSVNNLAALYMMMGKYEAAEPLYLEAKAIREKTVGKQHPDYADSLNGLANLNALTGRYEAAAILQLEAKAIRENAFGKENLYYAQSVDNLALVYLNMGDFEAVEPLLQEARTIREKTIGKENIDYCGSLINLGSFYHSIRKDDKAEFAFVEALEIFKKLPGYQNFPFYMDCLLGLANVRQALGNYESAEQINLEAVTIQEKVLGKEHPDYALSLSNLASLYSAMGNYEKAEPQFNELAHVNQSLITKAMYYLSERELNNYLHTFSESQTRTLSFAQTIPDKKGPILQTCYDNTLFYKGFLLNAANQVKRLALSDSVSTEKYNLLKSYERRLAAQYALPIAERDSANVATLETKANDLEKELARTVSGYGEAMRQVKWQEVQQTLKPSEAAIEFVHYRFYQRKETDSIMYAALLLLPGKEQPKFIPLFEEKQLDSLLQTQSERKADYVNSLYTVAERGVKPLGKPYKSLYELLWQPLEKELAGVQTIYFSPSGLLHRLNLGAIPISEEETLADRYRLGELGSTRQLVVPSEVKTANQDAMLFGGVQYEMDSTAISQANVDFSVETLATRGGLSFSYADSTLRGGIWNFLKWTEKEVTALEPMLKSGGILPTVHKGFAATEESFKSIGKSKSSPRILHIATHGFFFPDSKAGSPLVAGGVGNEELVFKISDHPMIRSGLILAGGNHAWQTGTPFKPGMEDGILTAYEISQMNLSNTELVVLSACETGLGDIKGNEGVYGLQRAFKIAGAKYLVMSLWQVPDFQTQELMTTFYQNWLQDKMSIPDAFRAAQKEMREKYQNPYFWAGFVLVE